MKMIKIIEDTHRCRFCGDIKDPYTPSVVDGFLKSFKCSPCCYTWTIDLNSKILHIEEFTYFHSSNINGSSLNINGVITPISIYSGDTKYLNINYDKGTTTVLKLIREQDPVKMFKFKYLIESKVNKILKIKNYKQVARYIKRFDIFN